MAFAEEVTCWDSNSVGGSRVWFLCFESVPTGRRGLFRKGQYSMPFSYDGVSLRVPTDTPLTE